MKKALPKRKRKALPKRKKKAKPKKRKEVVMEMPFDLYLSSNSLVRKQRTFYIIMNLTTFLYEYWILNI